VPGRRLIPAAGLMTCSTSLHDPATLFIAFCRVAGNQGANTPGVDGVTADYVREVTGVPGFPDGLRAALKDGSFRPLPVREKMIPKPGGSGKLRRLGIPAIADRVVQAALKLVLEPVFEAAFEPVSYGFRPKRRAQDAIAEIHYYGTRGYRWVLDADIEAAFDNVSHPAVMDRVRARVKDKRVPALVKAFLKAGVLTELGERRDTLAGTPQGGILSPLIFNIALSALDERLTAPWKGGGAMSTEYRRAARRRKGLPTWRVIRYADLCRGRHKSAYADLWIMPALSEFSLVKSGHFAYGVGIILRPRQRPGFLVRVSDSSGQEDDHGDEHSSRRRSADRGQHGAAGGVPQMAGPGAGPVGGVGPLLLQPGRRVPRRHWRGGSGRKPGRGQGHGVHGGLVPGP
jgi:group II intron reverse transcriptase/maturase